MTTVASRIFASTPARDALATWEAIVALLTNGESNAKRTELLSVSGIAASVIADKGPKDAAIVVTCDGPRTRIRCIYDEDALDSSEANEDSLGFEALEGDWKMSLPCPATDLAWVQKALKDKSSRITARDQSETTVSENATATKGDDLTFNPAGFLGS